MITEDPRDLCREGVDTDRCRTLLLSFPFKDAQLRFLELNKSQLADYFLGPALDPSGRGFHFDGPGAGGFTFFSPRPALGRLMGTSCHRIMHFLHPGTDPDLPRTMARHLVNLDVVEGMVEARPPIDDVLTLGALTEVGFAPVAVEQHMFRRLRAGDPALPPVEAPVEPYEPSDWSDLEELSRRHHHKNRFAYDPQIPDSVRIDVYTAELRLAIANPDYRCFVVREEGRVVAFNTAKVNRALTQQTGRGYGSLDYIVVSPDARRQGLALALSLGALHWLAGYGVQFVASRTLASNYQALGLLAKLDFRILSTNAVLHRWPRRS